MDICSAQNAVAVLSLALGSVRELGSSSSLHRVTVLRVTRDQVLQNSDRILTEFSWLPVTQSHVPTAGCTLLSLSSSAPSCSQLLGSRAGSWGAVGPAPCVHPLIAHLYRKVSQAERSPGDGVMLMLPFVGTHPQNKL